MPTDFAFRLSTYLTLFLSCAALGYAEWDLLPEAAVFAFLVAGLLGVAFYQEGRLEMSLSAANRLGMVIGIIAVVWIAFQIVRPSGGLIYTLPWPASMLPYIGPLVMILMPAKLFRPKHIGDWWTMHGVGLAAVALGCALADDLTFGILAACYLIAGAWSLSLFFLRRAAGAMPEIPGRPNPEPRAMVVTGEVSTAPKTRLGRAFAARPVWALAAAAVIGTAFFLATPRIDGPQWSLSRSREVGYGGEDSAPDLTRSGTLNAQNREVAFEVIVRNDDGTFKEDVSEFQRWRGRAYLEYAGGKWIANSPIRVAFARGARPYSVAEGLAGSPIEPEPLRPGDITFDFTWLTKKKDAILADPVFWSAEMPPPVLSRGPDGWIPWAQVPDGSFFPYSRDAFGRYRQVNRPTREPNLGPLFELMNWNARGPNGQIPANADPYVGYETLMTTRLVSIRDFARDLLNRLIQEGKIPEQVIRRMDPANRTVAAEDHEHVARAFSDFIAGSGEYQYDLKSPPHDRNLDPIEDFLLKSKVGSCERFATGLVLLLRGVGIPCKMIVGFKGCEYEGDGKYIVRQEHAHAWVEVLVRRPTPPGYVAREPSIPRSGLLGTFDPRPIPRAPEVTRPTPTGPTGPQPPPPFLYAWLSLDPTPGDDGTDVSNTGFAGSVSSAWQSIGDWFSSLIVRYNPEMRSRVVTASGAWFGRWWMLVASILITIALGIVAIKWLRERALLRKSIVIPVSSAPEWYEQFCAAAGRAGVTRLPHETPAEHAQRYAAALPHDLKPWPREVADLLAAVRYGGRATDPVRLSVVQAGLARVART
jgi:transglutaminase-like putative cysteine protease